jgi:hypothetical protein
MPVSSAASEPSAGAARVRELDAHHHQGSCENVVQFRLNLHSRRQTDKNHSGHSCKRSQEPHKDLGQGDVLQTDWKPKLDCSWTHACLAVFALVTETNRTHLVLFGMKSRTCGPYLAAIYMILVSVMSHALGTSSTSRSSGSRTQSPAMSGYIHWRELSIHRSSPPIPALHPANPTSLICLQTNVPAPYVTTSSSLSYGDSSQLTGACAWFGPVV